MEESKHLCDSCSKKETCNGEVIIQYKKINDEEGIITECDRYNYEATNKKEKCDEICHHKNEL